jgi:mutator protein MutT
MVPGRDYVGVGVGVMILDEDGRVFLAKRGPAARNEVGKWEFPGGEVRFGERLAEAAHREIGEEYGIAIGHLTLLGVFDHINDAEHQHWISATYTARLLSGTAVIREPEKCSEIGWFDLENLPQPLSLISEANLRAYRPV